MRERIKHALAEARTRTWAEAQAQAETETATRSAATRSTEACSTEARSAEARSSLARARSQKSIRGLSVKMSPSILAADFSRLGDELLRLEGAGADMAHIDVMDGLFAPNITVGPPVIKSLRAVSKLPFDVHLMIEKPERYIGEFIEAGASIVTVHVEACAHIGRVLRLIRELGASPAVALCPHTPLSTLEWILESPDMILLMTVDPGFGGQNFIERSIEKIDELRSMTDARGVCPDIEVDGGINLENAARVASAGANVIVAGSSLFAADDMKGAVSRMREAAQGGFAEKLAVKNSAVSAIADECQKQ